MFNTYTHTHSHTHPNTQTHRYVYIHTHIYIYIYTRRIYGSCWFIYHMTTEIENCEDKTGFVIWDCTTRWQSIIIIASNLAI